jgi:hypothetical protein
LSRSLVTDNWKREKSTGGINDVKKSAIVVVLAEMFCFLLGTTSAKQRVCIFGVSRPGLVTRRNFLEIMFGIGPEHVKKRP